MIGKTMADIYDYCCLHYAHKTAIVCGDERYTFSDLKEKGDRLVNAFVKLGLKRGDIMAVLLPNCPEVLFVDYACARLGIGAIPLANYLQLNDMKYMIGESKACAFLFDEKFRGTIQSIKIEFPQQIRNYICSSMDGKELQADEHHLQSLIKNFPSDEIQPTTGEEDISIIIYTGGTTGTPKGVVHNQRTWINTLVFELMELGIERNEVFLAATPLTHGARAYLYPTWIKGGSGVIVQGFQLPQLLETIQKEKVTSTFMVPTMIYALLNYPDLKKYDLSSLKNIIYGAAPISPDRLKEAVSVFGPIFTQSYGQGEVPTIISVLSKEDHVLNGDERDLARFASCGRPSLGMRHKLVDENGHEVPRGQAGEIVVKSPNMMLGYLNRPDITAETVKDGWLYTGDVARQDEEGYLYMVDRRKDMIVSGGFNVYPKEVEDTLCEHPAVGMAAVIGVPDDKWGESVKAVVVIKPGQSASEEELIKFCKARKGSTICPKTIDFVEKIPTTPLGKPDKKLIRAQYWKDKDRNVG
jgi:fatty-acyl-CoA synthase